MALDDFFPPSDRVLYRKPQLRQVVCQLRFPPILRIEGSAPADFQDQIRAIFPLLEPAAKPLAQQLPSEVVQLLGGIIGGTRYQFLTEDRQNILALARDSISLTSNKYTRWEEFRALLTPPLDALIAIYRPSFYRRIGLRYINVIRREDLGLDNRTWSALLNRDILGELALPNWERCLVDTKRVIRVSRSDGSILLQHGTATLQGLPEQWYSLDLDLYTEQRTEIHDATPILDQFNHAARSGFRWCITPDLHDAMEPIRLAE